MQGKEFSYFKEIRPFLESLNFTEIQQGTTKAPKLSKPNETQKKRKYSSTKPKQIGMYRVFHGWYGTQQCSFTLDESDTKCYISRAEILHQKKSYDFNEDLILLLQDLIDRK